MTRGRELLQETAQTYILEKRVKGSREGKREYSKGEGIPIIFFFSSCIVLVSNSLFH
jgi:hypothetical protein